ncbi:MAG: type II secretion system F family protein [Woeseiaceae bacterium]|nr:type II secretion system F family protein [Woeseiaceae bacterium]
MLEFAYKGRREDGQLQEGTLMAASASAAAGQIQGRGLVPVQIRPVSGAVDTVRRPLRIGFRSTKPRPKDMILFCRQMLTITRSGLPLLGGLTSLMQSMQSDALRDALADVVDGLESGRSLSAAFRLRTDVFSGLFVSLVEMGELTGTLDTAFERLYEYLQTEQDIKDRVRAAVRYPLIVLATIALALGIITVFVIPSFEPIFRNLEVVPLPTRIIMGVSDFAMNSWYWVVAAVAAAVFALRRWIATPDGRYAWDRMKLRIPIVGTIVQNAALSRLTQSLAVSLRAGLPLIQTLQSVGGSIGNAWFAARIDQLCGGVERGETLANVSRASALFTPLVVQMIELGEEAGALPELMDEASGHYRREVEYDLDNLSAALEPILIISVGVVVLILALGVFLPMWDMVAQAKAG